MTATNRVAGIDFGGDEYTVKQAGMDSWFSINRGWVIEDAASDLLLHAKVEASSPTVAMRFENPAGEVVFRLDVQGSLGVTGTRTRYELVAGETDRWGGALDQHSPWSLWWPVEAPTADRTLELRRPLWVLMDPTVRHSADDPCCRIDHSALGRRYTLTFEPLDPWLKVTVLCALTLFVGS